MKTALLVLVAQLFGLAAAAGVEFSYVSQDEWPGVCITGNNGRQSPININTGSAATNRDLIPLEFGSGWTSPVNGEFINGGHNVQFNPGPAGAATPPETTTHIGTYQLRQFHMHWGNRTGEGSEHLFNSNAYDMEVHFVHSKKNSTDTTAGDYYTVVGILFRGDDSMSLSGVWEKLSPATIMYHPSSLAVTDLDYTDLLPAVSNRGYYYYVGSLTTPNCDETVQWFVMQEVLTVPTAYLTYLRQIRDIDNETLSANFREPQPLGTRSVYVQDSGVKFEMSGLIVMLLVAASSFVTNY